MKRLKKSIAICVLVVIMAVMAGCGQTATNSAEIISPKKTEKISVELFDKSTRTFEGDAISPVTEMINNTTLTEEKSVQDTPDSHPLGTIRINDGEETIYYYHKNNKNYIEKPYAGIYETTIDIDTFFSEL